MAGVRFDVPPYVMAEGSPAEPRNINVIGLRRDGWSESDIEDMRAAYRDLWRDRGAKPLREAVEDVRESFESKPDSRVHLLCDWLTAHLENAIKGRMQEKFRAPVVGGRPQTDA
jgi:UDP-N-acetylglucosamine acyltransferase